MSSTRTPKPGRAYGHVQGLTGVLFWQARRARAEPGVLKRSARRAGHGRASGFARPCRRPCGPDSGDPPCRTPETGARDGEREARSAFRAASKSVVRASRLERRAGERLQRILFFYNPRKNPSKKNFRISSKV